MNKIRAVVVDSENPGVFTIQQVPAPSPALDQALVRVAATSLNLGEVRFARIAKTGARPGWDLAGTVEQAAADGSGPRVGTRVVGLVNPGAWAEVVAVQTSWMAPLPDNVSFAQAATLPVAALTALFAVEARNSVLGRSVLVTGASGGVGHFACQLARHAGARVIASIRHADREQIVREAGAHEVVIGEDLLAAASKHAPYDVVLESVGGKSLADAIELLAPRGTCVLYGVSEANESTIQPRSFYGKGGTVMYGLMVFNELKWQSGSEALGRLVQMVSAGTLKAPIQVSENWTRIAEVAAKLWNREIPGKAVLTF